MIRVISNKVFLKDRMVGEIKEGVYIKEVIPKKHYLVSGKGYAISKEVIDFLSEYNIQVIMIKEKRADGTVKKYTATTEAYKKGNLFCVEPFEMQVVIPLKELKSV
jgi:hypothetical protein